MYIQIRRLLHPMYDSPERRQNLSDIRMSALEALPPPGVVILGILCAAHPDVDAQVLYTIVI